MTVDLRRFVYPLEALRRKHEWQRDAVQSRLAAAEREVAVQREKLDGLRAARDLAAADCARASAHRLDPQRHVQGLAWIARLHARLVQQQEALAKAEARRDALREECTASQRKVELDERHRESCLAEYRASEEAHERTEADRDWIARRHLKPNPPSVPPAGEKQT